MNKFINITKGVLSDDVADAIRWAHDGDCVAITEDGAIRFFETQEVDEE